MNCSDTSQRVLWIGSTTAPEFSAARAVLQSSGCLQDEALGKPSVDLPTFFACVVVATTYPGEYTLGDWDRWKIRYRACQWVMLCGPWCRGRVRPPEFAARVHWHEFPGWWSGPASVLAPPDGAVPIRVGIVTAHPTQATMYEPLLRDAGITADWVNPSVLPNSPARFDFFLWDAAAFGRCRPLSWPAMTRWATGRPVVVVAPDLRPDDVDRWPGGTAYLSYPSWAEMFSDGRRGIVALLGADSSLLPQRMAG